MSLWKKFRSAVRARLEGLVRGRLMALDRERLAGIVHGLINEYAHSKPPDEALRFLFDMEARLYNLEGVMSVRHGNGIHSKHRHMRYHDFFVDRVSAGEKVLDVGCGNGAVAFDVAEKAGAEVVGIDLSEKNIVQARERFAHPRAVYLVGDALHDLPEGRFETIILSNVLEHLPSRPEFLKGLQAAARPSRMLIRVPLFERDWRVPLKKELGCEWRLDATHETEYTLDEFQDEMAEAGLEIVYRQINWGEIWAEVHKKEEEHEAPPRD